MTQHAIIEAAKDYLRRGWKIVPIPAGAKKPVLDGWYTLSITEKDLPKYFHNGEGIGIRLGDASNGLVDVDIDAPEALAIADIYLPKTDLVHGRPSNPRSHRWFQCPAIRQVTPWCDVKGEKLIELRGGSVPGHSAQTVAPPSRHPSGEKVRWVSAGQPAQADAADLRKAVSTVAAGALLARHWPAQGSRHDASLALCGMLLRAGWSEEETGTFLVVVAQAAHDEEAHERRSDVRTTARSLAANNPTTGVPELKKLVGDEVVDKVGEWLALAFPIQWPDPSPLGDELPPVQHFAREFLPKSFLPLVEDVSERMQTPMDYAAASVIVALAGCVNRRATIQPKAEDTSWRVVPNLWGAVIAPPGYLKTPVARQVTKPLTNIEREWRDGYEQEEAAYQIEKKKWALRQQAWGEQFKQSIKKQESEPARPQNPPQPPTQRRLLLTDATPEKLHEILGENPLGVFVLRDELTGWLAELDKLGREHQRAFFLEAWNGDGPFTMDRIERGSVHVPAVCVSLFGNIQPARLRSFLADSANDDGLFQRFQILVWPDLPSRWDLIDRPPNNHAVMTSAKVFSRLANLRPDAPLLLRFDDEGQGLFFAWLTELESKLRGESGLHPAMVAHLSKYRSLMPSLAALFELADRAAADDELAGQVTVNLEHAKQAAALSEYLESHARRVYACIVSPECRAARELARHIQAGDLSNPFKTRDVYLKGWSGLDDSGRVRSAIDLLEEAAWVRREEPPKSQSGGRPSETWRISPKVVRREK